MKILIIHTHYTQYGGEDTVVNQEAELLQQNNEVQTLYFKNKNGIGGLWQFLISIWNIKSSKKVKNKIKQFKPDVIHIHNLHFASGPIVIRTAKKLGIPIVKTLHNYRLICPSAIMLNNNQLFLNSLNESFPWSAIRNKVYKDSMLLTFWLAFVIWFHRKLGTWDMVSTYICLTPSAIELFSSSWMCKMKNKFTSKPNFSNRVTLLGSLKVTREDHYLFIGRLAEEKGITLLIDTFKELPYQLKIAGSGPLKNDVVKASSQFSNISYLGVLNKEEVTLELKKANALVFPSIWYETFGLVITEAFSNACAVISTNIGAPKSIVNNNDNGLVFKANSIQSFREAIKKWESLLLSEKESIRNNALKTFNEKYSPENQNLYFKNIYKRVT